MRRELAIQNLPPFKNTVQVNIGYASNKQLQNVIMQTYSQAVAQCKSLAPQFAATSSEKECRNVWAFLKNNIKYVADTGEQQTVKLPTALVNTGTGDCKSYTLFAAGVLANLGHTITIRFACYDLSGIPGHVYCLATKNGKTYIIDAVWQGPFNTEKKNFKKFDHTMRVQVITGIYTPPQGVGKIKVPAAIKKAAKKVVAVEKKAAAKAKTAVKNTAQKAGTVAKNVGKKVAYQVKHSLGAPERTAFLALVVANFHGFANTLAKVDPAKLNARWQKLGGDVSSLRKAIEKGQKHKAIFGVLERGIGIAPEAIAVTITAATPIIIALNEFLKASKETIDLAKNKTEKQNTNTNASPSPTPGGGNDGGGVGPNTDTNTPAPTPGDNDGTSSNKWLVPVGLGLLALFALK